MLQQATDDVEEDILQVAGAAFGESASCCFGGKLNLPDLQGTCGISCILVLLTCGSHMLCLCRSHGRGSVGP